jgi:hypothetical protein
MKPTIAFVIALLSGSFPLIAQQASPGVAGQQANFPLPAMQGQNCVYSGTLSGPQKPMQCGQGVPACPAMFTARHLSDGSVIRTSRAHPKGIGQWMHVTLNVHQGAIATLAVHGYSNKGRATETSLDSSPDAVRTVTVYLAPAQNSQPAGDVWAPELTAVSSIDLVSLNYDDGTSWSASSGQTCKVTPDPMMLISGR